MLVAHRCERCGERMVAYADQRVRCGCGRCELVNIGEPFVARHSPRVGTTWRRN